MSISNLSVLEMKMYPLESKRIAIINRHRKGTGIERYSVNLHKILMNHNLDSTLYQIFSCEKDSTRNRKCIKGPNLGEYSDIIGTALFRFYCKRIKDGIKADIIHISDPSIAGLIELFPEAILTVHDLYYLNNKSNSRLVSHFIKKQYERIDLFKYILANSNFTKESLIKDLKVSGSKIFVLYPGTDMNLFGIKGQKEKGEIGFKDSYRLLINVGYDNTNKNLKFLYRILSMLPEQYKLIRIGRNDEKNIEYTKKIGVYDRIKFIEKVSDVELARYYQNSDIFVYPTLYEGFGYGNIEAMASGLPVVTSNIPVMKEIVGKYGVLVGVEKPDEWVSIIQDLSNRGTYDQYVSLSRERAKKFSMENEFTQIADFYKRVFNA